MCILALNIVIDKIYLILWFWFLIVGLFGFIRICCRAVQIASAQVIKTVLRLSPGQIRLHKIGPLFVRQNTK